METNLVVKFEDEEKRIKKVILRGRIDDLCGSGIVPRVLLFPFLNPMRALIQNYSSPFFPNFCGLYSRLSHAVSAADSYCDPGLSPHHPGIVLANSWFQEDLYAFHARVFRSPAPRQLSHPDQGTHNDDTHPEIYQVEDDDLGYYPDGVKRTLTDDQIAMFRHSEIYAILRERQVRKENLEAEGVEQSEAMDDQPEDVTATVPSDEEGEVRSEAMDDQPEDITANVLSDEEGEVQSDGEVKAEKTPNEVGTMHREKKRKRGGTDNGYMHGKKNASRSARGFVRELDSVATGDQVLDYGDEPSTVEVAKQNEAAATKAAEKHRESHVRPAEGKKIWWPIIEAT